MGDPRTSEVSEERLDTIVYFGSRFAELELHRLPGARVAEDGSTHYAGASGGLSPRRRVVGLKDIDRALAFVRRRPVDALLVDVRGGGLERAHRLLEELYGNGRMGGPLLRQRVVGLVSSTDLDAAFSLGRHGIGGVLADPEPEALDARLESLFARRGHGKVAVCLAGGGIEGLLYELGVLRAIESFLVGRSLVDLDFFCGISAGAILGSLLANGIGPHEIIRALEGESRRLDPIGRWDLFEPNVSEIGARLFTLATELARGGGDGPRGAISSLTRAVPSAAFSGRRLGAWLERQLSRSGMSNRFDTLRRPLYVGATDQDTAEAVVFGDDAHRHVPVHRAVQASSALVPFYPPVEVDGRLYIDGAFSRTTNMRVAAGKGATLVLLIDPLVPVRTAEAGYVHARGGIYSTTQGLKALINGRFDKAVNAIAEMHPDVAFHLFRPEDEEMKILAGSPMKYFYRREVTEIAYEATVAKLRARIPQLERDFALHGIGFRDPDRGSSVRPPPGPGFASSVLGVS